ncbi:MAG: 16S rRNA (adenine(1518)-N(6)/adenine(1519)-N(6))-dimethyltransferase RsmA [Bacteroidota bacterium]|nr:16S rRNA (adenine(1518)-N(6)/adenine(1519)-N(6))-dimethyltransferase RsmA [Bacteroidota bacterium]
MFAKKSFGQHFLVQARVIERIAETICAHQFPRVLEIGPGKGAITKLLAPEIKDFYAIEADIEMYNYLQSQFPQWKDQFILCDFLKFNLNTIFPNEEFMLCGNFPYNISSQIVFRTLEHAHRIPILNGMFQREMALRIKAEPGAKDYSILSVLTAMFYDAKILFDIGNQNFSPPPKVQSSFLELRRKPTVISENEYIALKKLVKLSFQFRRKTLRNNLKSLVQDPQRLSDSFFSRRPEELSPQEFFELSKSDLLT